MTVTDNIRKRLIPAAAAIFVIAAAGMGYACLKPHVYPTELSYADSLLEINAEEYIKYSGHALKDRRNWNGADDWYYRLLCLKAKIKSGAAIKETDIKEADDITDYYKSFLADKRQLPYAYYYTGRAYSSRNDNPIAMDFYLKALDAADTGILQLKSLLTQTEYENEEIRLKYENAKQNYEIIKRKIALESNTHTQMMNSGIYKTIEEKQ